MSEHIPVLARTLAEQINLPLDGVMVDATIGQGGHSFLFGQILGPQGAIIGLDIDPNSTGAARSRLKDLSCRVILVCENFSEIREEVKKAGFEKVDFILADLGFSSAQLADEQMGLSFQADMPLDMRFDKRLKTTAADIVNKTDERSLADVIYRYSQERASRRIARFIVRQRERGPIMTTGQLAGIVCKALGQGPRRRRMKIHPATRTFQALRIAVNDELGNLSRLLAASPDILKPGGKIAVISYHSLEDRLVKQDFKEKGSQGIYGILTKKPIRPSGQEIRENPKARSARLRIAQRN